MYTLLSCKNCPAPRTVQYSPCKGKDLIVPTPVMIDNHFCAQYLHKNYIRLVDCKNYFCMVILNPLGKLLLEQGWSKEEVINLGYSTEETESSTEDYYQYDQEMKMTTVTSSTADLTFSETSTAVLNETTTEGLFADLFADMLTRTKPPSVDWEAVTSVGARVTEILKENVTSWVTNATEEAMNVSSSNPDPEGYPVFFKRARDYNPMFLPGPLQTSTMLIVASAILLVASKYALNV